MDERHTEHEPGHAARLLTGRRESLASPDGVAMVGALAPLKVRDQLPVLRERFPGPASRQVGTGQLLPRRHRVRMLRA